MKIEEAIQQKRFSSEHEKMIINILYTGKWLDYQESAVFKTFGLTQPQYNILRILRGQYPKSATVNLLIERMMDKSSNASRIVEKLRQKGWVERSTCNEDRRRVDVVITEKGINVLEEASAALNELHKMHNQSLTKEEAAMLNGLLDKLRTKQ
jgi:DNA-binding MarR family transcriptional regulator